MSKIRFLIVVGLLTISFNTIGQIAIDTIPDPSAALNIGFKSGKFKGLLIPRMTNGDKYTFASTIADYLLVFDTTDDEIYYYKTSKWISLNPWKRGDSTNLVTTNYDVEIAGKLNATSDTITTTSNISTTQNILATGSNSTISATRYLGYTVPPGGIIMYSGPVTATEFNLATGEGKAGTPYEGWALCIGNIPLGTPDLRGRFVVGQGPSYATMNGTGGESTVILNDTQIPAHNHAASELVVGSSGSAHNHAYTQGIKIETGGSKNLSNAFKRVNANYQSNSTSTDGAHNHPILGNVSDNIGGGGSHNNLPPYMILAYIMKLP